MLPSSEMLTDEAGSSATGVACTADVSAGAGNWSSAAVSPAVNSERSSLARGSCFLSLPLEFDTPASRSCCKHSGGTCMLRKTNHSPLASKTIQVLALLISLCLCLSVHDDRKSSLSKMPFGAIIRAVSHNIARVLLDQLSLRFAAGKHCGFTATTSRDIPRTGKGSES